MKKVYLSFFAVVVLVVAFFFWKRDNWEEKYNNGPWKVKAVALSSANRDDDTRPDITRHKEWSILICSMTERKATFFPLIEKLRNQILTFGLKDQVEILYLMDVRAYLPTGFKRNQLLKESKGTYVCFIDDDDDISDRYVKLIYEKLVTHPDCVNCHFLGIRNGKTVYEGESSIKYDQYVYDPSKPFLSIPCAHFCPMKRSIAIQFSFPLTIRNEDVPWVMEIVHSKKLQNQAEIDEPYYYYMQR